MASALDKLLEVLEGRDHWPRVDAIVELGELGDPAAIPALVEIVRDETFECYHTRTEAIDALVALRADHAMADLRAVLRDPDPDVRERAADALKQLRRKG